MKILVLQLARLGDIYLTWPTLRALKRCKPHVELHVLVRPRFSGALQGLEGLTQVWTLPSQQLADDLLAHPPQLDRAKSRLGSFLGELKSQGFDQVINLSFSPISSYLAHSLCAENVEIRGYSRHRDGFLHLPDDGSSYFYAQVGVGKVNRLHLRELFAEVAGVSLCPEDSLAPIEFVQPAQVLKTLELTPIPPRDPYLIFHMGASQKHKQYPRGGWRQILERLEESWDGHVLLVGSAEEALGADSVRQGLERVHNWCGRSSLSQLFSLVKGCDLVVGGDSLLMHIASMTETRCLNLSSPQVVNFWETGPLTLGSRILLESHIKDIDPNRVVAEIFALIHQQPARTMVMERLGTDEVASYHPSLGGNLRADFTWSLVQAIYMGRSLPVLEDPELFLLLERLNELCDLALTQLEKIGKSLGPSTSSDLLARVEEMMSQLGLMDSRIQPLVAWVQAEQVRIGPDSVEHLVEKNLTIYRNLKLVLSQYIPESSPAQDESYPAPHA